MTEASKSTGMIMWHDLTVEHAEDVRDFYASVVGWTSESVSMGDYEDYSMKPDADSEAVAGVCHARGVNADIPPQWLMYVEVADLDASMAATTEKGGSIVVPARGLAGGRMCVVKDPAGAVLALWQK